MAIISTAVDDAVTIDNKATTPIAAKLGRNTVITPAKAAAVAIKATGRMRSPRSMVARSPVIIDWLKGLLLP